MTPVASLQLGFLRNVWKKQPSEKKNKTGVSPTYYWPRCRLRLWWHFLICHNVSRVSRRTRIPTNARQRTDGKRFAVAQFWKVPKSNYLNFCPNAFLFLSDLQRENFLNIFLEIQTAGIWKDASNCCSICFFSSSLFFYWRRSLPEYFTRNILKLWSLPLIFCLCICLPLAREWDQHSALCECSTPTLGLFQVSPGLKSSHFPKASVDHLKSFKKHFSFTPFTFSSALHTINIGSLPLVFVYRQVWHFSRVYDTVKLHCFRIYFLV